MRGRERERERQRERVKYDKDCRVMKDKELVNRIKWKCHAKRDVCARMTVRQTSTQSNILI